MKTPFPALPCYFLRVRSMSVRVRTCPYVSVRVRTCRFLVRMMSGVCPEYVRLLSGYCPVTVRLLSGYCPVYCPQMSRWTGHEATDPLCSSVTNTQSYLGMKRRRTRYRTALGASKRSVSDFWSEGPKRQRFIADLEKAARGKIRPIFSDLFS